MPNPAVIVTGAPQILVVSGTDGNGDAAYSGDNVALPAPALPPIVPDPPLAIVNVTKDDPVLPILDTHIGALQIVLGAQRVFMSTIQGASHPARLVFWEKGRRTAEALPPGHAFVQYVTHRGLKAAVFFGDNHGDSNATMVVVTSPGGNVEYLPIFADSDFWPNPLWLGRPQTFEGGSYTLEWVTDDFTVLHTATTPSLSYGDPYP